MNVRTIFHGRNGGLLAWSCAVTRRATLVQTVEGPGGQTDIVARHSGAPRASSVPETRRSVRVTVLGLV